MMTSTQCPVCLSCRLIPNGHDNTCLDCGYTWGPSERAASTQLPKTANTGVNAPFFVFEVESVGLHGEGFAVAGGVYIDGAARSEFRYCCPLDEAKGEDEDREWVKANVPALEITHRSTKTMREAFWSEWENAKARYPGITMAGECIWPVEAGFVAECVKQQMTDRKWAGPYPFHDIASVMLAAGMDPMATYERTESEKPAHEPLADARLSARLLAMALRRATTTTP